MNCNRSPKINPTGITFFHSKNGHQIRLVVEMDKLYERVQVHTHPRQRVQTCTQERRNARRRHTNVQCKHILKTFHFADYFKTFSAVSPLVALSRERWFVLSDGVLSYYRNKKEAEHACRGSVVVAG